ncbi:MAG: hypothetical protein GWP14_07450 [Actinobacteria bacterium]|nr:hypothetical protein [Actinomycetota bacterium]
MSATPIQPEDQVHIQTKPLEPAPPKKGAKKLLSMGSTFLTVVVLTCLLWIWANQAQLLSQNMRVVFTVATAAESPLIIMSLEDGSGKEAPETTAGGRKVTAEITFKATRSRLRELQSDLLSGELELFVYLSERVYLPGNQTIIVADALNANDKLRDRGVSVVSAEPTEIKVVLDTWVRVEKVKLKLKKPAETANFQAYIDPPQIVVQVPASIKDDLQVNPQPLLVKLTHVPDKISPNLEVSATVSTKLGNHTVRPERSTVKVILQPIEQDKEKLGPLQIRVCLPPDMIGSHIVEWEEKADKMVEVELIGPRVELNKLKAAGKEKIMAFIVLGSTHAEPTETYYTVPVQFWFGEDIHQVKLVDPEKTVKVRLKKLGEK